MVPVQRLVMLLPVEEQAHLEPASDELHICEETFRVPAAGQLPTAEQQDPELDTDHHSARLINSFAVQHSAAQHPGSYYCWECEVRENTLYLDRSDMDWSA